MTGLSKEKAYKLAYPEAKKTTARTNVYKILKKPNVRARWDQMLKEAGKRNDVHVDEIVKNLRKARDLAMAEGKYGDVIRATELLGK